MSQQSRKHRGYATERLVASFLQQWWPHASVGRGQGKDVQGVPFDIEIKARNSLDISGTLRQIKARTSKSGELGFACFRLNGMGTASVEQFVCMLPLGDLVELLRKAGYEKLPADIDWNRSLVRCSDCGNWKVKWWECKACGKEASDADL